MVKASGAAKLDIAAVRKQKVGEQSGECLCSVTHLKSNLHSTSCQNRKANIMCPQHSFYQNGQMYNFQD